MVLIKTLHKSWAAFVVLALGSISHGFVVSPTTASVSTRSTTATTTLHAVQIEGYQEAFAIIDKCAVTGIPSDDLYDAVRVIDKNALKIYPNDDEKAALWDQAHGSWKLQLATGGGKFSTFKPVPIFAFAMIDEDNFGNGFGINQDFILLSLLGKHEFMTQRRQMPLNVDDMYVGASKITTWVPKFMANGMGLGKRASDWKAEGKRAPAFTFIGASDSSLLARGGSGGIAIWTRLDKDIRPAAYGRSGN